MCTGSLFFIGYNIYTCDFPPKSYKHFPNPGCSLLSLLQFTAGNNQKVFPSTTYLQEKV